MNGWNPVTESFQYIFNIGIFSDEPLDFSAVKKRLMAEALHDEITSMFDHEDFGGVRVKIWEEE